MTVPEVLNEPVFAPDPAAWASLQHRALLTIRGLLPANTIVLTGADWGSVRGLLALRPEPDRNVIYSFHLYEPPELTALGAYRPGLDTAAMARLPFPVDEPAPCEAIAAATTDAPTAGLIRFYCALRWDADKLSARIAEAAAWGRSHPRRRPLLRPERLGVRRDVRRPRRRAHSQALRRGAENAPAIVFIDELDAVGGTRSGPCLQSRAGSDPQPAPVELDGFSDRDQVVVMAASNRLQDLDTAPPPPRPVRPPDPDPAAGPKGAHDILAVHTRSKPLAADIDLETLARHTAGLTGADLANICNEAAIAAGRRRPHASARSTSTARWTRVIAGLQQRRVITPKEKRILAYHEGGHALMAHLMSDASPVQKATIIARGTALGYTLNLPAEERYLHTKEELID